MYTIFVINNHAPFHWSQKKNLLKYKKVSKYYNHSCKCHKFPLWVMVLLFFLTKSIPLLLDFYGKNT